MKRIMAMALLIAAFASGCGAFTRTIYITDGTPVRLREPIKGAKVWTLDKDGEPVASRVDLPEGWYVLPMPKEGNP